MNQPQQQRMPESLLPLSPTILYILLLLAERERHGYRLLQDLEHRLQGMSTPGAATLYRSLQYLLKEQLIEESQTRPDPVVDDKRRIYYRLTNFGRQILGAEVQRLDQLIQEVRAKNLLGEATNKISP